MTNAIKDLIIWDNFREGSRKALELVYEDNYSPLFHYALKFTNDRDLIKDLIQELFVELINSGKKLSRTDNIRIYLLKAMRYKIIFQLEQKVKHQASPGDYAEFSLVDSIEAQLIQKEFAEDIKNRITSSVRKLSSKQQEAIYLRFYNDIPYPEIASIFNIKIQTVRNLISRAIRQLKEDLENQNMSKQIILLIFNLSDHHYSGKNSD